MRFFLLAAVLLASATLRAETPPLLSQAIQKLMADDDHWAYTRTTQKFDKEGKPKGGQTIERYDPSQPFAQQWTLLQYQGHSPTEANSTAWRAKKEKETKFREGKTLADYLDLDHATVVQETDTSATFLVPLVKEAIKRLPADKVEIFIAVDKGRGAMTGYWAQPRQPFRVAGVLKLVSGRIDGRLEVIQEKYAPVLTYWRADGSLRALGLIKFGLGEERRFSDFKRVKPYNERFDVKIGDLKALSL